MCENSGLATASLTPAAACLNPEWATPLALVPARKKLADFQSHLAQQLCGLVARDDRTLEMARVIDSNAAKIGAAIAERAKAAGIEEVVFDRGGFIFHGKVKALADAAREGGLKF